MMNKKTVVGKYLMSCIAMLFAITALAADGEYSVARIPLSLLKNANVVRRLEAEEFILKNPAEATYKRKIVLTIMNAAGDGYAGLVNYYNKFVEIKSIEGYLYDANGKELKKLKSKDVQDKSGVDDNNLIDDTRYKEHNFYYKVYPYTVAYEVELKFNGTMFYPDWSPQPYQLQSVQESRFILTCPENYEFRYKAYQYDGQPAVAAGKGTKSYTWEIKNLPAFSREAYAPGNRRIRPLVLFGPTEFEMQNYKGNMRNWEDLGKFIYALRQGRDELPDDVKRTVHRLTDNLTDPAAKVKVLYEFLQQNSRYISIQLGIGGWQPFDAKFVAAKKYGDCKALSNYMLALLKEAGIPSLYTVISAGEGKEDIFTDFPSSQFNHAIVCVPLAKDTLWLECTDQFKSCGYMGGFTGNRHALVVDENGGKLVRTPLYSMNENKQVRNIKAVLDEEGNLQLKAGTLYTGMQQDDLHYLLTRLTRDKLKEHLTEELNFSTYDINSFDYKEEKAKLPLLQENLDVSVRGYASITGKRLFIVPNIMSKAGSRLDKDTARKYPIELRYAYVDIDTITIDLPAGFTPESVPAESKISSMFGQYNSSVKVEGNKMTYFRKIEHAGGQFPPSAYEELAKFYEAIYKADRARVVFTRTEAAPAKGF